jgi:flagellar protein FlgJ
MNAGNSISNAGLYTDFGGLARLRAKASSQTDAANGDGNNNNKAEATKEVAKQFEALFLQLMLKSMRDASQLSESTDSEQTRFYQDMFDKQVALDLSGKGDGIGLATMLERDLSPTPKSANEVVNQQATLVQDQIKRASSVLRATNDTVKVR